MAPKATKPKKTGEKVATRVSIARCVQNTVCSGTSKVLVKILTDLGKPISDERVIVIVPNCTPGQDYTNAEGIVTFLDLPVSPDTVVYVVLPDILEHWGDESEQIQDHANKASDSEVSEHKAKSKDEIDKLLDNKLTEAEFYRKKDRSKHKIFTKENKETDAIQIKIEKLTAEEKFQHFRSAYCDDNHNAVYTNATDEKHHRDTYRHDADEWPHWEWRLGAVCHQHVKFFLGYWFNYQTKYVRGAGHPAMGLVAASKSDEKGGYAEFLDVLKFACDKSKESNESYLRGIKYLPTELFFEDGVPNEDGKKLISSLADFNVYSVADQKYIGKDPKTQKAKWSGSLNYDHHCGILLRRGEGGAKATSANGVDLWTFSADGNKTLSGYTEDPIIFKTFAERDLKKRHDFHVAIWKLKDLRVGGYAPKEAESNVGGISIDWPPRFIKWVESI